LFIGATGSGKTTLGIHVLSHRSIDHMPFVILNSKDDELINQIPHVVELDGLKLPKEKHMRRGLWMARPTIQDFDGVEALMHEVWRRTHTGLFVDEALAISQPNHPAYRTLLTQGRSRRCPVDSLTQRPVNIDRYAFSESEHFFVMRLNSMRELDPIRDQIDRELNMSALPEFHAYRYHAPTQTLTVVPPAPPFEEILETFDERLQPEKTPTYFL
jgi:hypothetical protein